MDVDPLSSPPGSPQQSAAGNASNSGAAGLFGSNPLDVFRGTDGGSGGDSDSGASGGAAPRGTRRTRDDFEQDNPPMGDLDLGLVPPGFWRAIQPDFSGLVSRLTQRRRLNPDAAHDLALFSQEALGAQVIISYAMMLEIYDMLVKQWAAANYQIPEELKTNINKYCAACVMSPRASAYLPGAIECVLLAMRGCAVPMPPSDDLARTEIIKSRISIVLIDKRHKMKGVIAKTITQTPVATEDAATPTPVNTATSGSVKDVKKLDIASLCRAIVAKCGVRITLDMYYRVAFLRYCLAKYGNTDKFWNQVDARLVQVREKYPDSAGREGYFKRIYQADVSKYGAPARNGFVLPHQVDSWQSAVETRSRDNAARGNNGESTEPADGSGGAAASSSNSTGGAGPSATASTGGPN